MKIQDGLTEDVPVFCVSVPSDMCTQYQLILRHLGQKSLRRQEDLNRAASTPTPLPSSLLLSLPNDPLLPFQRETLQHLRLAVSSRAGGLQFAVLMCRIAVHDN